MALLVLTLAAAKGPPVLIAKSDGTEARGVLLSFANGSYRLVTKAGKELDIPATEIDLVSFPPSKGKRVEKLDLPPTARSEEGGPLRGPQPDLVLRSIPRLKTEGRLKEFVEREKKALRKSTDIWEAMRHLVRLRHAAAAEHGRDSPEVLRQMKRHLDAMGDPDLREELKKRLRWMGFRRGGGRFRGRPPRER